MAGTPNRPVYKPTFCPKCGKQFEYGVYAQIHIPGDHKLKKQLLNKTLFFPTCPYCKEQFKIKPNCIYINELKLEAFAVTDAPNTEELKELLIKGDGEGFFQNIPDDDPMSMLRGMCKRRIVREVDSFREKILLSDNNYDDRIIELMKLSLSELMEKQARKPVYRIFLDNTSGNILEFVAIMGARPPFENISVKTAASVYTYYWKKYISKLGKPGEDEYIYTDQKWAKKSRLLQDEDPGFVLPF